MSLRLGCAVGVVLCLTVESLPVFAQHQSTTWRWTDAVRESGEATADHRLLRETADSIAMRSPTFAQMLAILKTAPRLIVFSRPAAIPGNLGQSQFYITAGRTFVVMEINVYRLRPTARVRAIAHELAHAVEIACIPQQHHTSDLLRYLSENPTTFSLPGIASAETPFPSVVENVVWEEYESKATTTSGLATLAEAYGLPGCGVDVRIAATGR